MRSKPTILITALLLLLALLPTRAEALINQGKYQKATIENFSKLYWTLGMLDPDVDEHIDNYMAINECDIYKDYKFNEFEWKNIRDSARKMLIKQMPLFPTRYGIMQEIKLTDYDIKEGGFYISKKHDIESSRRFEVHAADMYKEICGFKRDIPHYPKGIILELSRPLELKFIPVHESVARAFIEETLEEFREIKEKNQTQDNLYDFRTAYMEINVKIFSAIGYGKSSNARYLAKVIGVLESVKIYADRKKQTLLYAKAYARRTKQEGIDPALKKQFIDFLSKREKIKAGNPTAKKG